jgi:hypothetical protein
VNKAVHAAEVNEGTKVNNRRNNSVTALAWLQVREEVPTLFLLSLFEPSTTRQHNIVAVAVKLNDLGFNGLTNVWLQFANSTEFNE